MRPKRALGCYVTGKQNLSWYAEEVSPSRNPGSTSLRSKRISILWKCRRALGPALLGSWCGPELSAVTSYNLVLSIHLCSVLLPPTSTLRALIIPLACYRSVACLNVITLNTRVHTCLQILKVSSIFTECIIIQIYVRVHSLLHGLRHINFVLCPQRPFFMHVLIT